jgi:hypothetical protein
VRGPISRKMWKIKLFFYLINVAPFLNELSNNLPEIKLKFFYLFKFWTTLPKNYNVNEIIRSFMIKASWKILLDPTDDDLSFLVSDYF